MELKLNIYKGKEIEKTYVEDDFRVPYGVIEDLLNVIDVENMDNDDEIIRTVIRSIKMVKPLLKDIFTDLTDEELRRADIMEIVDVVIDIIKFTMNKIGSGLKKKMA